MKKFIVILILSFALFSCSQNFKKKKVPPQPPQNYKEGKETPKNE